MTKTGIIEQSDADIDGTSTVQMKMIGRSPLTFGVEEASLGDKGQDRERDQVDRSPDQRKRRNTAVRGPNHLQESCHLW
jgi:hypothetical protein